MNYLSKNLCIALSAGRSEEYELGQYSEGPSALSAFRVRKIYIHTYIHTYINSLFDNAGYRIRKTEVLMWTCLSII